MTAIPDDEKFSNHLRSELDNQGFSVIRGVLAPSECQRLIDGYEQDQFRSVIAMSRHGFGKGEYKYYSYPLPSLIADLRTTLYSRLVDVANDWQAAMGSDRRYPLKHAAYLKQCHDAGQRRPTPLILRYVTGDFNCLHQDVYGELLFPIQTAILLSDRTQFSGGEFVITEQRPRRQSRVEVVPLEQGDAVVFAVRDRPALGTRGFYRAQHRHGVSRLTSGERHCLGIIFHDAT